MRFRLGASRQDNVTRRAEAPRSVPGAEQLYLSISHISGPLPSQLGNLTDLRFLWFANNSVTSLPRELGTLHNLRSLDGSNNSIIDRLPYALGKLRNEKGLRGVLSRLLAHPLPSRRH